MPEEELSEESTSSTEATVEEPTSKIKVEYGGKSREFDPEIFDKIVGSYDKGEKWETSYHKKGEAMNRERAAILAERKEIEENKKVLDEYRKIKKAFEMNPKAYAEVQKALNEQESAIPPAYKELETKTRELESNMAYDKALREISREYDDFDEKVIRDFSYEYDVNNPRDMLALYYNAWKGSQLPDLIEKAKAEIVLEAKKKTGLPSIGAKITPPKVLPSRLDDQYKEALKRIETEGAKF